MNALEHTVFTKLLEESTFKAVLNEKVPPGLRSVLHTQATRLERLAGERREAKKLADPREDGDD